MKLKKLQAMLKLCRAHGSAGEQVFIKKYLAPHGAMPYVSPSGEVLAYVVFVGAGGGVLFSGHVDTMHRNDAPLHQEIVYDRQSGMIYKHPDDPLKMPLGADNGAGCWLMMEMIDACVPGTYIFHRGEERGGVGSAGMATHHPDFLKRFKYAIAFDRRGTGNVITEMMVGRTCSDAFAAALSDKLGLGYAPDNTGSFTDTANYVRLIPECTNVSVGYDHEHGPSEVLDVVHLVALRGALVRAFKEGTGDLPVVRGVDDVEAWDKWGGYRNYIDADAEFCLDPRDSNDVIGMGFKDLVKWVRMSSPEDVADLLLTMAEEMTYKDEMANQEEM
jgi:hypothetical protein